MATYKFPDTTITPPTLLSSATPLMNRLLATRNLADPVAADAFLNPDYDSQLYAPELLHTIAAACDRLNAAMQAGEQIVIFSDYDCDGIPGAVVLHDYFKAIGYEQFKNYIPHRHYEGFGLSVEAIDKLKAEGVSLIITIDCGTTNVTEVAHAKSLGIDVIITDHHEPSETLPDAVAVVNPKLGDYPFTELCGTGVIFKFVQAMLNRGGHSLPTGWEKWWLDMVGVATIADMVPLVGENRVLAHYGLQVLRKSRRPGLQQLLKKAKTDQRYLTEDDIGFTIGPRINAASRMDSPEDAFLMLAETNLEKAGAQVEHLEKLNTERKSQVAQMTKELHKRVKALDEVPAVLVMGHNDWRPSLVGLAANKLAEEINRPVFLWGTDGNGVYKGSCRSGGGVSVVALMNAAQEAFIEHGGHHVAGGFSVKDEHIFTFGEELIAAATALGEDAVVANEVVVDAEITLAEINPLLLKQLQSLAPFGMANHKPLFAFRDVIPVSVDLFGKTKEHTKLIFQTDGTTVEAISFFQTPEQYTKLPVPEQTCTMIGHVEQSYFMGRMQTRVRVIDIV